MKTWKLLSLAAASAVAALFLSACASTPKAPADERIVVTTFEELQKVASNDFSEELLKDLAPGKVYLGENMSGIFHIDKMESQITEAGLLSARLFGRTDRYSFWKWLVKGETPYCVAFRFIWFDKDGKLVKVPYNKMPRIRKCMPGDPVRFSALASSETCRQYSIILCEIPGDFEKNVQLELKKIGNEMDSANPTTDNPLKEVKMLK